MSNFTNETLFSIKFLNLFFSGKFYIVKSNAFQGVTQDGIRLRIDQFQEMVHNDGISEGCLKKLNFVVDGIVWQISIWYFFVLYMSFNLNGCKVANTVTECKIIAKENELMKEFLHFSYGSWIIYWSNKFFRIDAAVLSYWNEIRLGSRSEITAKWVTEANSSKHLWSNLQLEIRTVYSG